VLHAEQTTLGNNPADKGVLQMPLVSSLQSNDFAVAAATRSSKEKGSDVSYTYFG